MCAFVRAATNAGKNNNPIQFIHHLSVLRNSHMYNIVHFLNKLSTYAYQILRSELHLSVFGVHTWSNYYEHTCKKYQYLKKIFEEGLFIMTFY